LKKGTYGIVTLHRPSNVDEPATLQGLMDALAQVAQALPLIFPVHPRTRKQLEQMTGAVQTDWNWNNQSPTQGVCCLDPLGYTDFMALVASARLVLTDSGGLQEETTVLGVPCLTLRENTERPVTITHGTNSLVGVSPEKIVKEAMRVLESPQPVSSPPPLWDGRASQRIVSVLRAQSV
jgi:UDP-N-acetylglucosamine 2-epimerase (non-hydrolysing)